MRFLRFLAAAASAAMLATPALAAPASTRIGDIVAGKPGQPTITVVVSMSCVFCRVLERDLFPARAQALIAKGYAIEIIPAVAAPADEATTALLRCGGTKGYLGRLRRLYATSSMINASDSEGTKKRLLARATDFGLTAKQLNTCFMPPSIAANAAMTAKAQARYAYTGTPSIYLEDKFLGHTIDDLPRN